MVVLLSTSCRSAAGRLRYIFNQPPHSSNLVLHRCLAATGNNIHMVTDPSTKIISNIQNGRFLEAQYRRVLARAKFAKKRLAGITYQAESIIISFADNEFDISKGNASEQVKQALQLVNGFMYSRFPNEQYVVCVQSDGQGGKLHCHVILNLIRPDGICVRTNKLTMKVQRKLLNQYLEANFKKITGRDWVNPVQGVRKDIDDLPSRSAWVQAIKNTVNQVKDQVTNLNDFELELKKHGVTVELANEELTYHILFKNKDHHRIAFRQYLGNDGIRKTAGLGRNYCYDVLSQFWDQKNMDSSVK